VIEKKTGEMKAELEAAAALVHSYVPPDPGLIQVVMNAGTASLSQAGPGVVVLKFPGYQKAGDSLALTFDSTVKALRQIDVASYLDDPKSPVTFRVGMQGCRRDELPRKRRPGHPGEPGRGPDHEQQLPEARTVAANMPRRQEMNAKNRRWLALVAGLAILAGTPVAAQTAAAPTAAAQTEDGGWHFAFTPYLWATSQEGEASFKGIPPQPIELSFGDIWENLDFAVLGAFEAHNGAGASPRTRCS